MVNSRTLTRGRTPSATGARGARRLRVRAAALAGVAALVAAGVAAVTATSSQAASSATVTVNASVSKGTIPAVGHGVNMAVWDGHMNDSDVPGLLTSAGVKALRYPGGSYGDIYHWKDHTAPGGYVAPNTSFDQFMGTAKAAGAQPVLIANYGSGTAQEAADWVRYANVTKGYGVKYWEIGNEIYGNGHYGADWETDNHADSSPKAYATNALQYISAMKAVDPTIKIGVVLTTPGSWPDGQVAAGDSADWNTTVMSIVGGRADFVVIHWYPGANSAADSLSKPSAQIPAMVSSLRGLIGRYAGSDAAGIGISVTELNPNFQEDSATAGLFAADSYLTWWENGVFNLDWWNLRNGSNGTGTNEDGTPDYKDAGILSSGSSAEPALNTPFPPYYGLSLAGRAGSPGDTLVPATSTSSDLAAHAVRTTGGGLNVLLINKDLATPTTVSLSYPAGTPSGGVSVQQWRKGATGITSTTQSSATSITVPPYSITLLKLGGGGSGSGPVPTPVPTATSTPTSTAGPGTDVRTGMLRGQGSRRCLRVASSATGATADISTCNNAAGQRWTLTSIGALKVYGSKCLAVPAGTVSRGDRVRIEDCTGTGNQRWTVRADGSIVNPASGLVLDVFHRRTANGTPVIAWTPTGAANQVWAWA